MTRLVLSIYSNNTEKYKIREFVLLEFNDLINLVLSLKCTIYFKATKNTTQYKLV